MDEHRGPDSPPAAEPPVRNVPAAADVAGQALPPSADTETVGRRQEAGDRRRSRGRKLVTWLIVVLLAAGLATAGFFTARYFNRVRTAQARIDAAAVLLDGAEEDLLVVDEAVQAEISSEIATQAADALALSETVLADARAAIAILDDVTPALREDMLPMAEALKQSAEARAAMMEEAPAILEADRQAALAIGPADAALAEMKAAEDFIGKAVTEFNKHTAAGVKQSTANSVEAEKRLTAARSLLTTATAAFPGADFGAFVTYIDAKLTLVTESKAIDALWLAGKIEESNAKLDAYNKKDAEIVAMAKSLPASIRDPIADAYEKLTAQPRDRYFAAREQARTAGERVQELRERSAEER